MKEGLILSLHEIKTDKPIDLINFFRIVQLISLNKSVQKTY